MPTWQLHKCNSNSHVNPKLTCTFNFINKHTISRTLKQCKDHLCNFQKNTLHKVYNEMNEGGIYIHTMTANINGTLLQPQYPPRHYYRFHSICSRATSFLSWTKPKPINGYLLLLTLTSQFSQTKLQKRIKIIHHKYSPLSRTLISLFLWSEFFVFLVIKFWIFLSGCESFWLVMVIEVQK